ncbi:MAG: DNA cytosine methyltransferase [Erysipelotrichaceae bacterium]|nr:DNA cytosine methyltransferase [Erysipelotrichaceae bacterium]
MENFLSCLGYVNEVWILNARHFGIPQKRERCCMISVFCKDDRELESRIRHHFFFNSLEEEQEFLKPRRRCRLKDRWRQVLNEDNRLKTGPKFLCTLKQGISSAQLDENVILVVPEIYIKTYPAAKRDQIWTIKKFMDYLKDLEENDG